MKEVAFEVQDKNGHLFVVYKDGSIVATGGVFHKIKNIIN